jgi:hypothetical protein
MTDRVRDHDNAAPVTLHRIMQSMIGEGLKERYQPPQKLSHELFVVLLQLKEKERLAEARRPAAKGERPKAGALNVATAMAR